MAQLPNDPDFQKLFKVVSDKYPQLSHEQRYYRTQRVLDEQREKRGNTAATREAAKIHQKTGRALTGAEGDLTLKPGASEGEQMTSVALAGDYPIGRILSGVRGAIPIAEEAIPNLAGMARKALGRAPAPQGARVVGKATVKDVGRAGSRAARGLSGKTQPARPALGRGKPDLNETARGTPRKVNPRASKTNPRAMGTNPRAVAARRAAEQSKGSTLERPVPHTRTPKGPSDREILKKGSDEAIARMRKRATLGDKIKSAAKKNVVPSQATKLNRDARGELYDLGKEIDRQGTRGKVSVYEGSGGDTRMKGATESAGRPYNMRDVDRARSILKKHGYHATKDEAENLISHVMHMELWK